LLVKLIQKKLHTRYNNKEKFNLLGKTSVVIPLVSILVLALGLLGFVRKGAAPFVGQFGVEMAGGIFSCSFFLMFSLALWAICYKWEL
jgi:hypothetical protein